MWWSDGRFVAGCFLSLPFFLRIFVGVPCLFLVGGTTRRKRTLLNYAGYLVFISGDGNCVGPVYYVRDFVIFALPKVAIDHAIPSPSVSAF